MSSNYFNTNSEESGLLWDLGNTDFISLKVKCNFKFLFKRDVTIDALTGIS